MLRSSADVGRADSAACAGTPASRRRMRDVSSLRMAVTSHAASYVRAASSADGAAAMWDRSAARRQASRRIRSGRNVIMLNESHRLDIGIDALMHVYDGTVPGAAILLLHNGRTVIHRGYGLADLEQGAPVAPATNFRLASLTKQFTASAILLLAEDELLGLDDPARKWLPPLPAASHAVTI